MPTRGLSFVVNDQPVELESCSPNLTLLDFLRDQLRLTGSKEGCAEGDCGACTVVVAQLEGDKLRFACVNSCILFVPMLHGKWLITIDYLAQGGALHPLQQAFVNEHASQCGFCTPGFVMALYALYANGATADLNAIEDAIAGNLCRCTGYQPIVAAARRALARTGPDHISAQSAAMVKLLSSCSSKSRYLEHEQGCCWLPASRSAALATKREHPDAVVIAGATDVGLWVTKQRRRFQKSLFLTNIAELDYVRKQSGYLRVGASASYERAYPEIATEFPALGALYKRIGGMQIRNSGTVVGNVANASAVADGSPAYLALGGSLTLANSERERVVPLDDFFLGYKTTALEPDELVLELSLPLLAADEHFRAFKLSKRFEQDISSLLLACRWRQRSGVIGEIRIAFGGMAATPKRAGNLEQWLLGKDLRACTQPEVGEVLAQDFQPISDMRASSDYRHLAAVALIAKLYHERERTGSAQLYELARGGELAAASSSC